MHIELAELLRCPQPHAETFCVVSPDKMDGRTVVSGIIGCPTCKNEYPIHDGIAVFATDDSAATASGGIKTLGTDAPTVQALLNLTGPGGNVALVGSATLLADDLASLVPGVHVVAGNAPSLVRSSAHVSVLYAPESMPLRTSSMRGVVLGAEMMKEPWVDESVRVLLRGTRWVSISETSCPAGIRQIAAGDGILVGEKI